MKLVVELMQIWKSGRGFRLSRCKMEYVECKFSKRINKDWGVAKFDGQGILEE